jgi:beta-glucosidase
MRGRRIVTNIPRPAKWFDDGDLHFALGIEDTFVPQARDGERPIDEYELTEHYEHYASDLELVTDVGARMLRWGVPWHRVASAPGNWDWSWVDRVMDRFGELGIRPIIDLLHSGSKGSSPTRTTHGTSRSSRVDSRPGTGTSPPTTRRSTSP